MLCSLHVENYALIRSLQMNFDKGFTVITGETGAGKSILLGALSLILGNRADTTVLHDKSRKCYIEGEFDIRALPLKPFFEENNLDYQDITILRREINEMGKSRAFVNDTPVVLPVLKALAEQLVDIHSQHQNLLLHHAAFRLNILDEFAQNKSILQTYLSIFKKYRETEKKWKELYERQVKAEEERDYLQFLHEELVQANLAEGEQEDMEKKMKFLSNAGEVKEHLLLANALLSEQEDNILSRLKMVKHESEALVSFDPDMEDILSQLSRVIIDLQEIAFTFSKKEANVEVDPREIEQLQERLDLLYLLEQKHHARTVEDLLNKQDELSGRLCDMMDNREQVERLETEKQVLYEQLLAVAGELSQARKDVATSLETAITQKLQMLGMENALFRVDISSRVSPTESGIDDVHFYFSANKGIEPEEIGKVASGGELSRLMLSIKSIITESGLLPTVIFDEIDAGISGEVAGKVANMMSEMSRKHQLLAITHLPQIAAKGTIHYFVYKEVSENMTYTNIRRLQEAEREEEVAKMVSAGKPTPQAIAWAKTLLQTSLNCN
ncbi:MAG: DNA repair protein RecN [Bacteroidales bacterium]|jgi:DNA repair protein RecN (Recombination protein N)|nr:DNA repair protein RecN [Bacteroidales bacterium]